MQCESQLHQEIANPGQQKTCDEVRRFVLISLTNLTFGNTHIKSYLSTLPGLLLAVVDLLDSPREHLHKASSHLLRNLAWKADKPSKVTINLLSLSSSRLNTLGN